MEDRRTNGVSIAEGTRPGLVVENEKFEIRFEAIQIEKLCSENKRRLYEHLLFMSGYDWTQVMEMVLKWLEYYREYYHKEDFQIDCQTSIKAWLSEYGGFVLMYMLLPLEFQKLMLDLYSHLNIKNSNENVVKSNLEMFEGAMELYKTGAQGLPMSELVPSVEVKLFNFISRSGGGDPTVNERIKMLAVKFVSQQLTLNVYFSVYKKRLRRSLVEHAAETVVKMVDDAKELEIPVTLKTVVRDKIIDADWVASYWWDKYKIDMYRKYKQKTVHQVFPVTLFPMMKS